MTNERISDERLKEILSEYRKFIQPSQHWLTPTGQQMAHDIVAAMQELHELRVTHEPGVCVCIPLAPRPAKYCSDCGKLIPLSAEQPVATPGATPPGEDSVWQSAESSRPRELLAQQMEPDTSPLTHQEIFSAVHHHAAEIVKLTAAVPAQCTPGASRDASPADLVGARQDVVHTDPGPVRAGHAVKSIECPQCFGDKQIAMSDWTSRTCEYCGGTGRVIPTSK